MECVNKAILLGIIVNQPEMGETTAGKPVVNFTVATTEHWEDGLGGERSRTEYHRCTAWDTMAKKVALHGRKGRRVYIEGKNINHTRKKKTYAEIKVNEFFVIGINDE